MKSFRRISARLPLIQEERKEDLDFSGSDDEAGLDQEKSSEDNLDPDAGTSRCQKRKLDDDDDDDFMMEELRLSTTRVEPAQKSPLVCIPFIICIVR